MIDNSPYLYGYGSSSGTGVLTGSQEGTNIYPTVAGIIVSFNSPEANVETFLSDTSPLGDYTVYAYSGANGTGTLLDSLTVPGSSLPGPGPLPGIYVGFSDSVAEIGSFQIGPSSVSGDAFAIDDLTVGSAATPMSVSPEPSSLVLLGTGLVGIVSTWRRRANS